MRLDLHCHTEDSHDAFGTLEEVASWAKRKGIDAVAITNHDFQSFSGVRELKGVRLIGGIELSTGVGHILGIMLTEELDVKKAKERPIDEIHKAGGYAVVAHPFSFGRENFVGSIDGFDGVEVMNANDLIFAKSGWDAARRLAERTGLGMTAGSDAHMPKFVGTAYVEVEARELDEALALIMEGKGEPKGSTIPLIGRIELALARIRRWCGGHL